MKRRLMGKRAPPLPEQVTKQSGNSLLNLHLSGDYADLSWKHLKKINKCDLETLSPQSLFIFIFFGMHCQLTVAGGR